MSNSYSNVQRKLRRLWNTLIFNENLIKNPLEIPNILRQQGLTEPIFILDESEWIPFILSNTLPNINRPNTIDTNDLPQYILQRIPYEYEYTITIPDDFFPFVKHQLKSKVIPTSEISPAEALILPDYRKVETVIVGGNQNYRGAGRVPHFLYSQTNIDSGEVNSSHLKKVWFLNGSNNRRVNKVIIRYDEQPSSAPCGSFTDYKELLIDYHLLEKHEIESLTSSNVSGIGSIFQHSWQDLGSGCEEVVTTVVDKSSVSKSFTDSDVVFISITTETSSASTGTGFSSASPASIPSPIGGTTYWLYYTNDKYPPRLGFDSALGDSFIDDLPIVDLGTITATPTIEEFTSFTRVTETIGFEESAVLKLTNNTNNINDYKIRLTGQFEIKSKPIKVSVIDKLDANKINTYTWNGSDYDETTEDTEYLVNRYQVPEQDVQYKVLTVFKNPLYYRHIENKTYE